MPTSELTPELCGKMKSWGSKNISHIWCRCCVRPGDTVTAEHDTNQKASCDSVFLNLCQPFSELDKVTKRMSKCFHDDLSTNALEKRLAWNRSPRTEITQQLQCGGLRQQLGSCWTQHFTVKFPDVLSVSETSAITTARLFFSKKRGKGTEGIRISDQRKHLSRNINTESEWCSCWPEKH